MKILVLFKTHLDIGFTDFSAAVVRKYNEKYIPQAVAVAEEIATSGRPEGFIWTTGSWLPYQYLRTATPENAARMTRAICNRWFSWHGLPCTLHSEYADGALYDFGLSISRKLDDAFDRHTIGAKYTDVPGHTAAIVPRLARAGIQFLHIGVNPASTSVDVPPFFRWKFAGAEINVMYNGGDYGEFTQIPGTDTAIYFAHTGDNMGPQSAAEIFAVYDKLYAAYPGAEVRAADLNDVADAVAKVSDLLPVVDWEMGDTWIHGIGTDPQKTSQYRALLRLAADWPTEVREKAYDSLLLVPEHTWGLDEKKHLHQNCNYRRDLFDRVRNDFDFKRMELSWAEQRRYVQAAAESLPEPYHTAAAAAMQQFAADRWTPVADARTDERTFTRAGWHFRIGSDGAICALEKDGKVYADDAHPLAAFSYDAYSGAEVWAFEQAYLKPSFIRDRIAQGSPNWATDDFGKENLENEVSAHTTWAPTHVDVYAFDPEIVVHMQPPVDLVTEHGVPAQLILRICPTETEFYMDFQWFDKPANRAPEALWLRFACTTPLQFISKLGVQIDPRTVRRGGNRGMHGTDGVLTFGNCTLETLDAPLVSVSGKHIYEFPCPVPDGRDVYFNLFNNQWGTNFPMWNEGAARFRFCLRPSR